MINVAWPTITKPHAIRTLDASGSNIGSEELPPIVALTPFDHNNYSYSPKALQVDAPCATVRVTTQGTLEDCFGSVASLSERLRAKTKWSCARAMRWAR